MFVPFFFIRLLVHIDKYTTFLGFCKIFHRNFCEIFCKKRAIISIAILFFGSIIEENKKEEIFSSEKTCIRQKLLSYVQGIARF